MVMAKQRRANPSKRDMVAVTSCHKLLESSRFFLSLSLSNGKDTALCAPKDSHHGLVSVGISTSPAWDIACKITQTS
ncbi:Uncharacterized protein TCM_033763 [Theobroma cacao]|uniref:Uncharacterized protein n=1 Tax=Theobroma cacao TaxID=3641 RepID=A0A061FIP1_THECC|nr:Uncharacterized protein TCM_033763 [Theobroma cacao]